MEPIKITPKYSVKFNYRESTNQIYLIFRYDNKRVQIYTKENIESDYWNKENQCLRNSTKNPGYNRMNNNLNDMAKSIGQLFERFIQDYERKPDPAELRDIFKKEYFDKIPQFQTKRKNLSLIETFDEYIESKLIENGISTARKYQQAKQNLIDFGKKHKQPIQYENINQAFRNKFVKYLKESKKYADSTIYRKMKFIKTVLLYGMDNGYIEKLNINLNKFLTKDSMSTKIALSEFELSEIEDLDLSDNPRLDKVRDRFLIGCYTGLRFSDFIRLNKNHIDGNYIIIKQKKTGANVTLPFFDGLKRIFEKYQYNLPKPISEPNFNLYLKEVTRQCESLKRLQETTKNTAGKETKTAIPRSELVTSHTARRTFVTVNSAKGIDLETLTIATGHTTVKALKTYLKLNNKQKADILANEFMKVRENEAKEAGRVIRLNTAN